MPLASCVIPSVVLPWMVWIVLKGGEFCHWEHRLCMQGLQHWCRVVFFRWWALIKVVYFFQISLNCCFCWWNQISYTNLASSQSHKVSFNGQDKSPNLDAWMLSLSGLKSCQLLLSFAEVSGGGHCMVFVNLWLLPCQNLSVRHTCSSWEISGKKSLHWVSLLSLCWVLLLSLLSLCWVSLLSLLSLCWVSLLSLVSVLSITVITVVPVLSITYHCCPCVEYYCYHCCPCIEYHLSLLSMCWVLLLSLLFLCWVLLLSLLSLCWVSLLSLLSLYWVSLLYDMT